MNTTIQSIVSDLGELLRDTRGAQGSSHTDNASQMASQGENVKTLLILAMAVPAAGGVAYASLKNDANGVNNVAGAGAGAVKADPPPPPSKVYGGK